MAHHALLIGIDSYSDPNVKDLSGCVNDINEIAGVLTKQFGFADSDLVKLITEEDTTRERILGELAALVERTAQGDVAVVYYSGHGSQVPDTSGDEPDKLDESIVPSNSGRGTLPVRDIVDDELHSHFVALAKRSDYVSFVFDSCHSGSVDRDSLLTAESFTVLEPNIPRAIPPATSPPEDPPRVYPSSPEPERDDSATGLIPQGDYLMLGGCRDPETAKETVINGKTRGLLSYYLAQELQASPSDPAEEVFKRAAANVKKQVDDQTPVLEGPERLKKDAAFSTKVGAQPEPSSSSKESKTKKSLEWDAAFAWFVGLLLILIVAAVGTGGALVTKELFGGQLDALEITAMIVMQFVLAGTALAGLGAYIGLIEVRGRAHVLQRALPKGSGWGDRGTTQSRGEIPELAKELGAVFEQLGKMPTARALIAVGGVVLVGAAAFAWHVVPGLEEHPPAISHQPSAVTVPADGKAFFRVTASGSGLSYQWQRDGQPIDQATASTLLISPVKQSEDGDLIAVAVSNGAGETVSEDVALAIEAP